MVAPSPWYRYLAEAQAWPLASEDAFRVGSLALERGEGYEPTGDTTRLQRTLLTHLRPLAHGLSLEVLSQLVALAWFGAGQAQLPLHAYVIRLAEDFLDDDGDSVVLRATSSGVTVADRAAQWRWLSLRMPVDLLIAAATRGRPRRNPRFTLALPNLRDLMREPVAETHLHLGGTLTSTLRWVALCAGMARADYIPSPAALDALPPVPLGSGAALLRWLLAAGVARLAMGAWLDSATWREGAGTSFSSWLREWRARHADHGPTCHGVDGCNEAGRVFDAVFAALCGDEQALSEVDLDALRALHARILDEFAPRHPDRRPDALNDPLATLWAMEPATTEAELALATRGLDVLVARYDPHFARCFWQYQRLRGVFHRYLTVEPGTAGLDWFGLHFRRTAIFGRSVDAILPALAMRHHARDLQLQVFEARVAPPTRWTALRDTLLWFVEGARTMSRGPEGAGPEVGLVLHFLRQARHPERGFAHADPVANQTGCRHRAWFRVARSSLRAMAEVLRIAPEALAVLRGVDVANEELGTPNWAVAPLIHEARVLSARVAALLRERRPEWEVGPFRVTLHAGEDYRRLVGGLRRIHELLRHDILREGDRIGHGIALGVDPERWHQQAGCLAQPANHRLHDLLWELDGYARNTLPASDAARVEAARREARELADGLFDRVGIDRALRRDLDALVAMRDALFGAAGRACLTHDGPHVREVAEAHLDRSVAQLVAAYLTDPVVFRQGQRPVAVHTTPAEVRMLHEAQAMIRRDLTRSEITVEVNPSSNLLIGNFVDLQEHPSFRMCPLPGRPPPEGGPVMISLNTDDPLTFATSLVEEYAHLYLAMVRAGVANGDALTWLDGLRRQGARSRFTLRASRRIEVLDAITEALRHGSPLMPDAPYL